MGLGKDAKFEKQNKNKIKNKNKNKTKQQNKTKNKQQTNKKHFLCNNRYMKIKSLCFKMIPLVWPFLLQGAY